MVLFNRFGLTPLALAGAPGLDTVFRAAETAATQLANGMAHGAASPANAAAGFGKMTRASISEIENGAQLDVVVPGFGPDDIELSVKRDTVTVRGSRGEGETPEHSFTRTYRVGYPIDVDSITAKVEHGILTVTLPRHASESARVVRIAGQSETLPIESGEDSRNDSERAD